MLIMLFTFVFLRLLAVLSQLTKLLKLCLNKCKQLCTNAALASASKKELESIVAEKLIYNYAIEMCQSAAVEELFGHPAEVSFGEFFVFSSANHTPRTARRSNEIELIFH